MSMQRATPKAAAGAAKNHASAAAEAPSKVKLKAGLRGKDLDAQTQMLRPAGADAKGKSAGNKSAAKGGSAAAAKPTTKAPVKAKSAAAPVDESDPKQLILDQMAREWRAGETAEYEDLKAQYEKLYGPIPGEGAEPAVDEDKQQMQQLLGTYWRNGEVAEFEALKKVYEKSYGAF
jgi:hypothetical protein